MHFLALGELIGLLTLGAALGFFGGLFGIGGGIIAIPMLVLAFGMEQALAQGTSLAMMVPILAMGLWRYSRKRPIPWKSALWIGLLASVTTWVVAHFATQLQPDVLRVVFGVFLLVLSAQMLMVGAPHESEPGRSLLNPKLMPMVGVAAGTSMGLLGVGGGLVATPLLMGLFGQRQALAQSLSMALVTLIGAPVAVAQSGGSSTAVKGSAPLAAPVGHRQPRAADVPNEKNIDNPNDLLSKENAALDKKLKSICRGC